MNVIYCFKLIKSHYKPIDAAFFKLAKLSVDMAKLNYNTVFYCDFESEKMFKENDITFDEVIHSKALEEYDGGSVGVIKILTMIEQTEPYIISDFDSIIFKKLIQRHTIDFAYVEQFASENTNIFIEKYKKPWYKYKHLFEDEGYPSKCISKISNHGIVMVSHPILVSEIYKEVIRLMDFELERAPAMFIEQFLLTYYLDFLKVDYGYIKPHQTSANLLGLELLKSDFIHYIAFNTDTETNFNQIINFLTNRYLK